MRRDPVTGRWVILSEGESAEALARPEYEEKPRAVFCPFCPGHEDLVPGCLDEVAAPGGGWLSRVVPNKFPALAATGDPAPERIEIYDRMNGWGAHEVVIEDPSHEASLATLPLPRIADVLHLFQRRQEFWRTDPRCRYLLLFRNHGPAAGATLAHPHSQIIGLPILPKQIVEEMAGAERYYDFKERCVFCDILEEERASETRMVFENDSFSAITPYAARVPFEIWILPRAHAAHFRGLKSAEVAALAEALRETLGRLARAASDPPYNLIFHTAPIAEGESPSYHWHIEIAPRLGAPSGIEWGTGLYYNPVLPETAAAELRKA